MTVEADIAVIGGGIAGVGVAAELAPHRSVVLLEREKELAYHTTGRSAAAFLEAYGSPEIRALTRGGRALMEAYGAARGAPLLTRRGELLVAGPEGPAGLEATVAEVPTLRSLTAAEAVRLCGALRESYVAGAAYDPEAADIDVLGLHQHYLGSARRHGATVLTGADVRTGEWREGRWRLTTGAGEVRAEIVVNAAGAWADRIAEALGQPPVGLTPMRRTAAVIDTPDPAAADWPLVVDAAETFYFRPESGGLMISPADETPSEPVDARAEELDVALAIERVNEATTLGVRSVRTTWAGLRTFAPDRNPVAGYSAPGFCWLAGQGGYGIQTAAGLSRLAAALVLGEPVPDFLLAEGLDPARLSPARFPTPR
ncbi:MAG: FAD-dependent oxidoreductase [Streptosporangiales bacterium]|nr:FAD-dependent oxidoreductase [Streptosporangiales bacterium]